MKPYGSMVPAVMMIGTIFMDIMYPPTIFIQAGQKKF
jgi:hypothetical protein